MHNLYKSGTLKIFHTVENNSYNVQDTSLFYTSSTNYNSVRIFINQFSKTQLKILDLDDHTKLKELEGRSISITDEFVSNNQAINISKSIDSRYHNNMAWQRHLNSYNDNGFSIGHLRGLKHNIEPLFREGQVFQFNLNAIRKSDLPNHKYSSPTGLSIEEACQIARYIGGSTDFKSFNLVCTQTDIDDTMAECMAMILWYLFEGLATPKNHPKYSDEFTEFIVEDKTQSFFFLQSNINGKWWLRNKDQYIPCTYEEYENMTHGNLSNRLLNILDQSF